MEENLSEYIYSEVVEDIVTGKINTESVLKVRELIDKYGVSQSPVRDALVKLCNDNILYSIPRYGYKVRIIDKEYLEGIKRFRNVIEVSYLDHYFDKFTNESIDVIRGKLPQFEKDIFKNPTDYWNLTSEFHILLAEVYRDQYYYDELKKILSQQLIVFSQLYWTDWGEKIESKLEDNHSIILNHIEAGDKEKAIEVLQKDIQSF